MQPAVFALVAAFAASLDIASGGTALTTALLRIAVGAGVAVASLGAGVTALDSLGPQSASAYRAAALDLAALVGLAAAGGFVLASNPDIVAARVASVRDAVVSAAAAAGVPLPSAAAVAAALVPAPAAAAPPAALAAAAAVAVTVVASVAAAGLARGTLLFAPLLADVVSRASPRARAVAVTYNGVPPDGGAALLGALSKAGVKATFFVSAADAAAATGAAFVCAAAAGGHELGLLGAAGGDDAESVAAGAAAITAAATAGGGKPGAARATATPKAGASPGPSPLAAAGATAVEPPASARRGKRAGSAAPAPAAAAAAPAAPAALWRAGAPLLPPAAPVPAPGVVTWYRPADGSRSAAALAAASSAGLGVALWSAAPFDWAGAPSDVGGRLHAQLGLSRTLTGTDAGALDPTAVNGAIVCLHAAPPADVGPAADAGTIDAVGVTAAVLATLAAAPGAVPPALVTLSQLCPGHGVEAEVLPVA